MSRNGYVCLISFFYGGETVTRLLAVMAGALALTVFIGDTALGGAKDGKMRWSHQKTGGCKWDKALVVPAGQDSKPGLLVLKITYKSQQLAEFFVIGDGDTDLDLVVKDAAGTIVAKDVDPPANQGGGSDLCVCRWTPDSEQEYTIIILNNGPVVNVAMAGTN
jgi:hypothetical protein